VGDAKCFALGSNPIPDSERSRAAAAMTFAATNERFRRVSWAGRDRDQMLIQTLGFLERPARHSTSLARPKQREG